MNILFLDIDGVLNTHNTYKKHKDLKITPLNLGFHLEKDKLEILNQIIEKFDFKIVISSSWRFEGIDLLKKKFKYVSGIEFPLIDITKRKGDYFRRDEQILEWVINNKEKIDKFIAIDDEIGDMFKIREYLIKTCGYTDGLTEQHIKEIEEKMQNMLLDFEQLEKILNFRVLDEDDIFEKYANTFRDLAKI